MKYAVLGTGVVGQTIGSALIGAGHEVRMGARATNNDKAAAWVARNGERASQGTFAEAAAFGERVVNATSGMASLDALGLAGADNLNGKILLDISNPLDFSKGMPPTLSVCNDDSVGEQIQRAFPGVRVVKSLNTLTAPLMLNPTGLPGDHDVFLSGNDADAKAAVRALLESFGWKHIHDLGDITTARGVEQILPLWIRLMGSLKSATFNFHVVRTP